MGSQWPRHGIKACQSLSRQTFRAFSTSASPSASKVASFLPRTVRETLALEPDPTGPAIQVHGWVRSVRAQKKISFVELGDGSSLDGLQCVVGDPELAKRMNTGTSVQLTGRLVSSPAKGQKTELKVDSCEIIGECDPATYPLAKTKFEMDYLREHLHLRTRTRTFAATWRFRDAVTRYIHDFFESNEFHHINTPLITSQDCEGGGEVFRVSAPTGHSSSPPAGESPAKQQDNFFGQPAYLTVSGQLHLELASCGSMPRVYTLGPTFRAEPAHTTRHLAEFWMLEAEVSFMKELEQLCSLVEACLKLVASSVLRNNSYEVSYFSSLAASTDPSLEGQKDWLLRRIESIGDSSAPFLRMSYTDAVETLVKSGREFQFPVEWGKALQTEHERFLAENIAQGPVFVTDYPLVVKPFYMRVNGGADLQGMNEADLVANRVTVACTDLLLPRIGELVGGSIREERLPVLLGRMESAGLLKDGQYDWYADLRRFGTVPHGGFGLGLERLLMYLSGIQNARDVSLVPRYVGSCRY